MGLDNYREKLIIKSKNLSKLSREVRLTKPDLKPISLANRNEVKWRN